VRAAPTAEQGWILFDDACGFCSRWVPFWGPTLHKRGFAIALLQADWLGGMLPLDSQELLRDLRLLLRDGRQLVGADVYRYVMRRIVGRRSSTGQACARLALAGKLSKSTRDDAHTRPYLLASATTRSATNGPPSSSPPMTCFIRAAFRSGPLRSATAMF
jgi:predicted DCC family thiol-disulfide oxidoreductase YuxK